MSTGNLLFTCEHGGNTVPAGYRELFAGHEALLDSHRGWDPGSLALGRYLSKRSGALLISSQVTRLLVELNRSPHNPRVFSSFTRSLPKVERESLMTRYHAPYWAQVRRAIDALCGRERSSPVIHIGVHTFTPVLDGKERPVEVGLLYDPARAPERAFSRAWAAALKQRLPTYRVRMNNPYRGNADGLTTAMRREYDEGSYLGVELEVNQKLLDKETRALPHVVSRAIADALASVAHSL